MSFTYSAFVPLAIGGIAVGAAEYIELPGAAPLLAGGAAMIGTLAAWQFSPLPHSYGWGATTDPTAGHWGFGREDSTDSKPTENTMEDTE